MPRWKLKHTTITYAGRIIVAPDSRLEDTNAELNWGYTAETVDLVGRARPAIRTRGNTSGSLSLPVVTDYPDADAAFAAAVELRAWAEGAQRGELVITTGTPPDTEPQEPSPTYQVETVRTNSAEDSNLNAVFIELDPRYARIGALQKVTYKCRTTSGDLDTAALYLAAWEQAEQGGDNWGLAAVSYSTDTQAVGKTLEFEFDPEESQLHGRAFRLALTSSSTGAWQQNHLMGLVVSSTPSGDATICKGANGSRYAYIPQVTLEYQIPISQDTPETPPPPTPSAVIETQTPGALTYRAALTALNISLTLAPSTYRVTATYEFILT